MYVCSLFNTVFSHALKKNKNDYTTSKAQLILVDRDNVESIKRRAIANKFLSRLKAFLVFTLPYKIDGFI